MRVSQYFPVFESLTDQSVIDIISAVFKANKSNENISQSAFFCAQRSRYMHVSECAASPSVRSVQTPRARTACGPQVPPTAQKHSCCCLPRWQWSGRLQPAGPHAILSAATLSQLVNMFLRRRFSEKTLQQQSQAYFCSDFCASEELLWCLKTLSSGASEGLRAAVQPCFCSTQNITLVASS